MDDDFTDDKEKKKKYSFLNHFSKANIARMFITAGLLSKVSLLSITFVISPPPTTTTTRASVAKFN